MELCTKKFSPIVRKLRYGLILSAFFALSLFSNAQNLEFDTQGTDFWLTFMPNYHDADHAERLIYDNNYIYFTGSDSTNVFIEYWDLSGRRYTQNVFILNSSIPYEFQVNYEKFELLGDYPDNTYQQFGKYAQRIQKATFHITSDKDISVYGLSSANYSSEAFLVFPSDVINKEYMVMSYNSDGVHGGHFTPSQFSIIATEDNTNFTIIPTCPTSRTGLDTIKATINRGDAYLVQAELNDFVKTYDLTGSQIISDKPIAVFGGHQRATIPYDVELYSESSRDCLIEQIPPLSTWGKNAFVIPFPQPENIELSGSDKYRVLSAVNQNRVIINGDTFIINKGHYYEADLNSTPIAIQADNPILVAQYKKTPRFNGSATLISDPLMMIIPPKEQFINECLLINVNKTNPAIDDRFRNQYIFVVAPDTSTKNCFVDGNRLLSTDFKKIGSSGYSYTVKQVSDGSHKFKSYAKCGLYVVGYGPANSYGYVGGMEMKIIVDSTNPKIAVKNDCFRITGRITDSLNSDSGIETIVLGKDSLKNVRLTYGNLYKGTPFVQLAAELIDKSQDGFFSLEITDVWGNKSTYSGAIQGATLAFASSYKKEIIYDTTQIGSLVCDSVEINNYGHFPITIDRYSLTNWNIYSIPPSNLPLVIQPNTTEKLEVCFNPSIIYDSLPDTLKIYNSCLNFKIPLNGSSEGIYKEVNSKCDVIVKIGISQVPKDFIFEEVENKPIINSGKLIFGIPKQINTKFVVHDMLGNEKKTLIDSDFTTGFYEYTFDYSDWDSGVYFITMMSNNKIITRKFYVSK